MTIIPWSLTVILFFPIFAMTSRVLIFDERSRHDFGLLIELLDVLQQLLRIG